MRSNRVRSLLGLHDVGDEKDGRSNNGINGSEPLTGSASRRSGNNDNSSASSSGGQGSNRRGVATTLAEEMMIDTEDAVLANFDFLSSEVSRLAS